MRTFANDVAVVTKSKHKLQRERLEETAKEMVWMLMKQQYMTWAEEKFERWYKLRIYEFKQVEGFRYFGYQLLTKKCHYEGNGL